MKKRVILFLTVFAMALSVFVIAAGAADIYDDYTKPGANGEKAIFTFLGYAVDEEAGSICVDYRVNLDALEEFEKASGTKLNYGVVAAYHGFVENGKPLDATTGLPTGADKDKILTRNITQRTAIVSIKLTGLTTEDYKTQIFLGLYILDGKGVKYITDDSCKEAPDSVDFAEARGPLEVTIGNITYSTDGVTEPAADRIKQKAKSDADYKTGSSESVSLYSFMAGLIVTGGNSLGMPDAAKFMKHFRDNTGKDYQIDVASMLSGDSGALSCRNTAINNALRAAEALAREGETFTINQLTEGHPMQWQLATNNWQYSLGSYFDDVDVINLTVTEVDGVKVYSADIKYIVTDFYNWDTNDYNKFKDIISPHQLHELHKAGKAREFMSYGEITYSNITWTEGQTVSQIAGLN